MPLPGQRESPAFSIELPADPLRGLNLKGRLASVEEAVNWPSGPFGAPVFTPLYEVRGLTVGIAKPGKEADPDRKRVNVNDMTPLLLDSHGNPVDIPRSFGGMWGSFEELSRQGDRATLALCGRLIFRNAYFLDHSRDELGRFRYSIHAEKLAVLASTSLPETYIPPDVLMFYLEAVALNEDVKYWTLRREHGAAYDLRAAGRINNLMTTLHFILALLGECTLAQLVDAMSRGRGVAALSQKRARELLLNCTNV